MKALSALACIALVLCISNNAQASVAFYARPSVCFTKVSVATDVYTSNKMGFGIAAGCTLGSGESFSFELEAISTTGMKAHDEYSAYLSKTTYDYTVDMTQCLFSFRYTFPSKDSPMRIFIGPTAGYWNNKKKFVHTNSYYGVFSPPTTTSETENGFLLGPTLGVAFKVSSHARIELGYRQAWMLNSEYNNGHMAKQVFVSFNHVF